MAEMVNLSGPIGDDAIHVSRASRIDRASIETAIPRETLRVWERRYGFPNPGRDECGDRIYSSADIEKLKVLKRLVNNGHRPGAIVHRTLIELQALYRESMLQSAAGLPDEQLQPLLDLVRDHNVRALRVALKARMQDGLERFVLETVAPLSATVGIRWALGELESFQERLVTELLQNSLIEARNVNPGLRESPVIALATLPEEKDQLGLQMAQALFEVHGVRCTFLGTQIPVEKLRDVAITQDVDVVAISASPTFSRNAAGRAIAALNATLPASIETWLSGTITHSLSKTPMRTRLLPSLIDIRPTIESWRAARPLRLLQRYYH